MDKTSWFLVSVCYREQLILSLETGAYERNFNKTVIENVHKSFVCCWKCALGEKIVRMFSTCCLYDSCRVCAILSCFGAICPLKIMMARFPRIFLTGIFGIVLLGRNKVIFQC
uniref:Putative ovule protein n=1 Tax=Solanum chacoense TaxID=4108 RepID=A0A0V0GKK7_SOLCH